MKRILFLLIFLLNINVKAQVNLNLKNDTSISLKPLGLHNHYDSLFNALRTITCPEFYKNYYYDSITKAKYIFTNIHSPISDPFLQVYGSFHQFFLADSNSILVMLAPNQNPNVLHSLGYNYKLAAVDVYEVQVKTNAISDLLYLRRMLNTNLISFNSLSFNQGCTWWNDPYVFLNNNTSNMWHITDSVDYCSLNNCTKYVYLPCGNIDSVETLKPFMQPSTIANPKVVYSMFDEGGDTANAELPNMLHKWNFHINSSIVSPGNHGNGTTSIAIAAANNNIGGVGVAHDYPWLNMDVGATPGSVSAQACHRALDSMLVIATNNPYNRYIINQSYGIYNDLIYYAKVQLLNALTTINGSKQVFFVKSSGNSGPGTIDPPSSWTDFMMIGGSGGYGGYNSYTLNGVYYEEDGMWTSSSTGPGTDFCADAQAVIGMFSTNGTFTQTNGTSCAAPIASGSIMLLLSQDTTAAMNYDKLYKRLRGGARDVAGTPVGYDTAGGWGTVRAYKSLKYAVVEDYPRHDMVDSSIYPIDANNNASLILPFTPKFFNSSTATVRTCLYPNGNPIPHTVNADSSYTFLVNINTLNGFTNGGNNVINYFVTIGGCTHPISSLPFGIINIGGPPPPPNAIIANQYNFNSGFCSSDSVVIKLMNVLPSYTVTVVCNNDTLQYNAIDSSVNLTGHLLSPTSHLKIWYTNAINTTQTDSIFSVLPYSQPSGDITAIPNAWGVCLNDSVTFYSLFGGNLGNAQATYQWYVDGVAVPGADTTYFGYKFTNGPSHNFYYTVTLTGGLGCYADTFIISNSRTVGVTSPGNLAITMAPANGLVCLGGNANLVVTNSTSAPIWSGGITNGIPFTPPTTTTYTVTGTVNGCAATATRTITVSNAPPVITLTSSPYAIDTANKIRSCSNNNTLTLTAQGAPNITWSGGITNGISFTPTNNTTYTVTASNGCISTSTVQVYVLSIVANITSNPANAVICSGQPITLSGFCCNKTWSGGVIDNQAFYPTATNTYTLTTSNGPPGYACTATATIQVTVLGTGISTTLNDTICNGQSINGHTTTGVYVDTFLSINNCDSIVQLNLYVKSQPGINITATPNDTICAGTSIALIATGGASYSWSGGIVNGLVFTPLASGTYTVTVTGANGCTNTQTQSLVVNPLPSISIIASPNDTLCAGTSVSLTATGGTFYSWTGGLTNGTPFTPTTNATYIVTVTSANGCTKTQTQNIVVNPLPGITISTTPNDTLCAGTPLILTASGGASHTWSGGISNGVAFTPLTSGTYTVTATANNGCTNTQTQSIVIKPQPTVTVSTIPNDTICNGTSLILTATGGTSYSWSGGIVNGSAFTPLTSGIYTVTATGANGCTKTQTQSIVVNPLPSINITASPNDTVCTNDLVTLTASGGSTFSWTGGINNGTPFAASSNTTYTVTVTGANGCTQTQTQSVVVNTLPSISITTSPNDTVCTNDLVTLTANGGSAYSWTGGINNGIPFAASSNTTYTVTVTGANGCTQTQTQSIVVNSLPNISITVSPNDTVCANDFVTLAAGGGATYSWTGGIINGVSFMPTANGNYTVTVTDTNGCTNTQIQSVVVNVNITPFVNITSNPTQGATNDPIVYMASTNVPPPYIIEWYRNNSLNHTSITNTWSDFLLAGANIVYAVIKSPTQCLNPDSAKSNNLEIVNITGVGNVFPNGFSIYPNPTEYVLTIEGLEFGDEYVIYDALGKKLLNGKSIANSLRLDVGQYSNGIYHIHFSRNQLKWTAKFIRK